MTPWNILQTETVLSTKYPKFVKQPKMRMCPIDDAAVQQRHGSVTTKHKHWASPPFFHKSI